MTTQRSPVTLVTLDLDSPSLAVTSTDPGARIWVEVTRQGQILGVLETVAAESGLSQTFVDRIISDYSTFELSPFLSFPDDLLPRVSIVVPTAYRRADHLMRTVSSLMDLDYPDYEIIVVDNRRGFGHAPMTEFDDFERVRVETEPVKGGSSARNRGIACATGEIIAFTDDDVLVDRNWLRALAVAFTKNPDIDAIGGMVRPSELETEPQLWFEEFYGGFTRQYMPKTWSAALVGDSDPLFPYAAGHYGAGCNMALRRTSLERYGTFNVNLGIGTKSRGAEDLEVFMKVILGGGTVAFEPTAIVRHTHRETIDDFMKQVRGYGTGLSAMYTSFILDDPRHAWEIMKRLPQGIKLLVHAGEQRSPSERTCYPRRTQMEQFLGLAYGPFAYLWSVWDMHRTVERIDRERR